MTNLKTISEQEMLLIKKKMFVNAGINLHNFKNQFLIRRINARMTQTGVKAGSEYANLLETDPIEPLSLYDALSINVTEFFRNKDVWHEVIAQIIPKIIAITKPNDTIRVWSAGCATGEEAYSLAIIFQQALQGTDIQFSILGTDMSLVAINVAQSGKYDLKSLKNVQPAIISRYFENLGDQIYQINDNLKKSVTFNNKNIEEIPKQSIDLIFCRNLLIYYEKEAQTCLFKMFHKSLQKYGFLVLGMDETMHGTDASHLFSAVLPKKKIYQKKLSNIAN